MGEPGWRKHVVSRPWTPELIKLPDEVEDEEPVQMVRALSVPLSPCLSVFPTVALSLSLSLSLSRSLSLSLSLCQVVVERAVVRSSWQLDSEKLGEMETGEELLATESVTHPQVSNIRIHRGSRVSLSCIMRIDSPFPCFTLVCERCGC